VWKIDTQGGWRADSVHTEARPRRAKEATVPIDLPLDELLVPPEWDLEWGDLLLPEELPRARTPWYSDWDERE
jgi:hypothetical protein